jgi:hypothetical protein
MNEARGPVELPVAGSSGIPYSGANILEYAPSSVGVKTKTHTGSTLEGKQAARGIAIELLATLQSALGDLDKIKRIVKLLVVCLPCLVFDLIGIAPTSDAPCLTEMGKPYAKIRIIPECTKLEVPPEGPPIIQCFRNSPPGAVAEASTAFFLGELASA